MVTVAGSGILQESLATIVVAQKSIKAANGVITSVACYTVAVLQG